MPLSVPATVGPGQAACSDSSRLRTEKPSSPGMLHGPVRTSTSNVLGAYVFASSVTLRLRSSIGSAPAPLGTWLVRSEPPAALDSDETPFNDGAAAVASWSVSGASALGLRTEIGIATPSRTTVPAKNPDRPPPATSSSIATWSNRSQELISQSSASRAAKNVERSDPSAPSTTSAEADSSVSLVSAVGSEPAVPGAIASISLAALGKSWAPRIPTRHWSGSRATRTGSFGPLSNSIVAPAAAVTLGSLLPRRTGCRS